MSTRSTSPQKKEKICIIGGGAAGMACAWSLSRFPERFDVHVWESLPDVGGVASTCEVSPGVELNDQVQGGAPSYRNNLLFFKEFGYEPNPVDLRVAFGRQDSAWTNHSDSKLVQRLQPEIEKFGKILKWVNRLEPVFVFIPIKKVLKWWGFSDDFSREMVFPLTALFFGTGNQTPNVSAAVIARVFLDPQLRLFQYSSTRLLDEVPTMFAFPKLGDVFGHIAQSINATVRTDANVERVIRGKHTNIVVDSSGFKDEFDQVVMCCGAEQALKLLVQPSWLERNLLSKVEYFNDLIVTHQDEDYMHRLYQFEDKDMYFVRTDPEDREKIEMSFNLSMYQPHLQDTENMGLWQVDAGQGSIYQSIFLNDKLSNVWTVGQIDEKKVLKKRITRQFAHTWKHFAFWVPYVRFLQGKKRTWFAGSYTLFNTHEIAVMSGLAVAERLGASYPFAHDKLATAQFDTYLSLAHGMFVKRKQKGQSNC